MTLQVGYPHDRRSREPRPLKAREIWSIAEHVRHQFLPRRPKPCGDLERLVRAARKILVNGIEIVVHWDLDRSVRDGKGREALGVTEVDPALPGVLLISLNAELIAERDYATHIHGGQVRKGTSTPYVAHLLAVAATVLKYGGDEDLAIAALLHDSVEDQGGKARLTDVRNRFGERVARIVEAGSDSLADTAKGERKAHWQDRKEDYLAHLQRADEDILRVSLADKVHNARAILRDLRKKEIGEKIRDRFSQPKERTLWYYRSLADKFCTLLPGQLSEELREIVDVLERAT